jgi:hypothetical protein
MARTPSFRTKGAAIFINSECRLLWDAEAGAELGILLYYTWKIFTLH